MMAQALSAVTQLLAVVQSRICCHRRPAPPPEAAGKSLKALRAWKRVINKLFLRKYLKGFWAALGHYLHIEKEIGRALKSSKK